MIIPTPEVKYRWYSPYVRVWNIDKITRLAEISNFPRAYKDLDTHIYTEDVPFIVAEDGFIDALGNILNAGDMAYHYIGEPLPGEFPVWLEYEEALPSNLEGGELDLTFWSAPITTIEAVNFINLDTEEIINLTPDEVEDFIVQLRSKPVSQDQIQGSISIPYLDNSRVLVRVLYTRVLT